MRPHTVSDATQSLTGQPIEEPEVDLSAFLQRQRLEDLPELSLVHSTVDDDDVDHSLTHITSNPLRGPQSRKGKIQHIKWDASLEEMQHDKNVAQAQSGPYHPTCLGRIICPRG